jgi:hypothetical protein
MDTSFFKAPEGKEVSETWHELISETRQKKILEAVWKECELHYLDAKRSIVSTTAQIPPYIIVLLIVLGWNEFVTIISSPIYFILFLLISIGAYVVYALNLQSPLQNVGVFVMHQVLDRLKIKKE